MSNYIVCVSDKRHSSYEVERQMLDAAGMTLKLCACSTEDELIAQSGDADANLLLSLIHISEPTRLRRISYAVFCLKKKR